MNPESFMFEEGDVVRLKSGDPNVIVCAIMNYKMDYLYLLIW